MTTPIESEKKPSKALIILILGLLTALSPFSIDMYLPAFPQIASDFATTVARVSLSLSGYFVGLAVGQLLYGPLLDRFGRRRPLFVGLSLYILASVFCLLSTSTESLIAWRVVQALGGCAAGVGSMAIVRDLFETRESAKVFSLMMLILGASPLLAPTIGGYLSAHLGWHSIFVVLAVMGTLLLLIVKFYLPESHQPDPSVSLRVVPNLITFLQILRDPKFFTFALSGAVAFSGLFIYLAGSPVIFLGNYNVGPQVYGWIFAIVASGFIVASQLNVLMLKTHSNLQLLHAGYAAQIAIALFFLTGTVLGWFGLISTVALFFLYMACFGFTNSNSAALALSSFGASAGRAAAMMGFLQMGVGSIASTSVGFLGVDRPMPVVAAMTVASVLALLILRFGRNQIRD